MNKVLATLLSTAFGLVLLSGWIAACSFAFWSLLMLTPEGITTANLNALAWPFVTTLIAVPLLATILIGGLRVLGQILSLQTFLRDLPQQVRELEGLASGLAKNRQVFETSVVAIKDASAIIDQSTSQIADMEARLKKTSAQATNANQTSTDNDLTAAFWKHQEAAKELFDSAAATYGQKHPEGVKRVQGWILDESVTELKREGDLTENKAKYVSAVLDVDRRTRRAGRANLKPEDIQLLDRLARL